MDLIVQFSRASRNDLVDVLALTKALIHDKPEDLYKDRAYFRNDDFLFNNIMLSNVFRDKGRLHARVADHLANMESLESLANIFKYRVGESNNVNLQLSLNGERRALLFAELCIAYHGLITGNVDALLDDSATEEEREMLLSAIHFDELKYDTDSANRALGIANAVITELNMTDDLLENLGIQPETLRAATKPNHIGVGRVEQHYNLAS